MIHYLILILVALIPPIFLMCKIYKQDKIEREPKKLVAKVFLFGALSIIPVFFVELGLDALIKMFFTEDTFLYILVDNIIGVALVEELGKYFATRTVWKKPDFNYRFDGIVYAVAAALGFAAIENILYVFENGVGVGLLRAALSIPGHCIDGIFMGIYFGAAKFCECHGDYAGKRSNLCKCIIIPMLLHGVFDALLSFDGYITILIFLAFMIILDIAAIKRVKKESAQDMSFYGSGYDAPTFDQPQTYYQIPTDKHGRPLL